MDATALLVALASFLPLVVAADGTFDFSLRESAPVCVGKICNSSNAFWYYNCCDTASDFNRKIHITFQTFIYQA